MHHELKYMYTIYMYITQQKTRSTYTESKATVHIQVVKETLYNSRTHTLYFIGYTCMYVLMCKTMSNYNIRGHRMYMILHEKQGFNQRKFSY